MKSKIIGLLLILWGCYLFYLVFVYWDRNEHNRMRTIFALLTGGSLILSGFRCIMPAKNVLPVLSDEGVEKPPVVNSPSTSPPLSARKFSSGTAPLVGVAVGAAIGLRLAFEGLAFEDAPGHLGFLEGMLLAMSLGFGGGCVVWLRESLRNRASRRSADRATPVDEKIIRPR